MVPSTPTVAATPLLRMRGMDKSFPGVHALRNIDLELHRGEVLAILGGNGAGKSTLINILGGAILPDRGTVEIEGKPLSLTRPGDAQRAGISVIYQEFNLIPTLTVRENILLGHEITRAGFVIRRAEQEITWQLLRRLGAHIHPDTRCRDLNVAEQQIVEIAKALSHEARILVMDEPTASLTNQEVDHLFRVVRELKAQGIGVLYVSHRLHELESLADRVLVLRDGAHVATRPMAQLNRQQMIELMVGRKLEQEFPKQPARLGEDRLVVRHLTRGTRVREVAFTLRRGEVLGITGLMGAGRTDLARLLFGAEAPDAGEIVLDGRSLHLRTPHDAIRAGICLLTEDRKAQGLILNHSVQHNFSLPNLPRFSRCGFVRERQEQAAMRRHIDQLRIKLARPEQPAAHLSGGNQQKVVLAKWLETQAEIIIFDEPTRGIDVAAKYEVYQLMNRLAAEGKSMIMISSELPEVLGMCDRILVMRAGRVVGEITDVSHARQQDIMELAVGHP